MSGLVLVLLLLLTAGLVGAGVCRLFEDAIARRERRRVRAEQLIAEVRLQQLARLAMQQMLAEARKHQSQSWQ